MPSYADTDEAFTARYLDWFARKHGRFDFYGVGVRSVVSRSFDDGYMALNLQERDHTEAVRSSGPLPADGVLARHRWTIVRGAAGAGKSSMLRWLGVDRERLRGGARHGPQPVPFLIELADHPTGQPPHLPGLVGLPLRADVPDRWVERLLADGRVVLLLDGLDEVRPHRRHKVEEWTFAYMDAYPDTRCMITTRPQVVAEQWWVDRGFVRLDLLPMTQDDVAGYVRSWHAVARAVQGTDDALDRDEETLVAALRHRSALQTLSLNPLLCGLLCMLHWRHNRLPDDRKEICEKALELLLEKWPGFRHPYPADADGDADGVVDLDEPGEDALHHEEKLKLLARIAKWMLENQTHSVERETFAGVVETAKRGLRSVDRAHRDRVVAYLAQRSGVMREHMTNDERGADGAVSTPDSVRFIHRMFRDYLAAKELVDEYGLDQLLANADRPDWEDVVLLAGAVTPRVREREYLARKLMERADRETSPADGERLNLLAAVIVRQSWALPDKQLDDLTTAVYKRLVPPRSLAAANQLAAAGRFVVELLGDAGRPRTPRERAMVVRVLALIAARAPDAHVIDRIQQQVSADPGVVAALLVVWGREGGYDSYAREVLAHLDLSGAEVKITSYRQLERVDLVPSITRLTLTGELNDLGAVGRLPRLRTLVVNGNGVTDLSGLRQARSLQDVELWDCGGQGGRPVDLTPLAALRLHRLGIVGFSSRVSLSGLAGAEVSEMVLAGAVLEGLVDWPPDLRVDNLTLRGGQVPLHALRGVGTVTLLRRLPSPSEVADLNRLADRGALRRLVLAEQPRDTPSEVEGLDPRIAVVPDPPARVGG